MTTTIERMARLEQKVDNVSEKLDQLIEGLDKRYASKLTEKIVYSMAGLVLTAVLVFALGFLGLRLHPDTVTQTVTTPGSSGSSSAAPSSPDGSTTVVTTSPPASNQSSGTVIDGLGRLLK